MATKKVDIKIDTGAARWWIALEPSNKEFKTPKKEYGPSLETGIEHLLVYYVQGKKDKPLKITVTCDGAELARVNRKIGPNGFAYGHKEFTP
ncbi:MAG TPA: hypothetical protein PKE27_07990 [Povalibacter sp.]|uniref:hypothetical protein n=1 Tax=Povalibacter sp. TaxID=1962978 RepID=UPI002BAAB1D5|nr:hypothetical protein [Povalibacter sp.]HMN44496.1 hypothetical protein [Povalibacter sp.]